MKTNIAPLWYWKQYIFNYVDNKKKNYIKGLQKCTFKSWRRKRVLSSAKSQADNDFGKVVRACVQIWARESWGAKVMSNATNKSRAGPQSATSFVATCTTLSGLPSFHHVSRNYCK